MKMTKAEYASLVEQKKPKSRHLPNLLGAFVVGGLICCAGQAISELLRTSGAREELVPPVTTICMVFLGALLTGLGLYDRVAKLGGAGTLVPITGFANAVAAPAIEFRCEGVVTGTMAKMFIIAGPVIVFGVTASALFGLILALTGSA